MAQGVVASLCGGPEEDVALRSETTPTEGLSPLARGDVAEVIPHDTCPGCERGPLDPALSLAGELLSLSKDSDVVAEILGPVGKGRASRKKHVKFPGQSSERRLRRMRALREAIMRKSLIIKKTRKSKKNLEMRETMA